MPTSLETLTFRQAAERYPAFSESALRWQRFNGRENGFDACVIKLGARVLLDAAAFERWLETHRAADPRLEAAPGKPSTPGTIPKARIPRAPKRPVLKPPAPARNPNPTRKPRAGVGVLVPC